jgi:hypothetical protein
MSICGVGQRDALELLKRCGPSSAIKHCGQCVNFNFAGDVPSAVNYFFDHQLPSPVVSEEHTSHISEIIGRAVHFISAPIVKFFHPEGAPHAATAPKDTRRLDPSCMTTKELMDELVYSSRFHALLHVTAVARSLQRRGVYGLTPNPRLNQSQLAQVPFFPNHFALAPACIGGNVVLQHCGPS